MHFGASEVSEAKFSVDGVVSSCSKAVECVSLQNRTALTFSVAFIHRCTYVSLTCLYCCYPLARAFSTAWPSCTCVATSASCTECYESSTNALQTNYIHLFVPLVKYRLPHGYVIILFILTGS